ncbi:MAG TPA: tRNA guanosine(34) transglycosylase Tgt [Sandaracinaceae bacterium LLY-WYZ-13_1]|nr:tRNA guanosine(34) transglycosylase Tgt [Sandaracinaceae bacterium LLY-WYZ-13_1]
MPTEGFSFEEIARDGDARRARFVTPRAVVETPVFMPVGTLASVKSMTPAEVEATGARLILANTYHLWLRPGPERVAALGGVQGFMAWPHALLTDSGGFQVFSMTDRVTIEEEGVTFRSHLDGTRLHLTPEESMRIQRLLGSDVAMLFDECPPGDADRATMEAAVRRTTRWAQRCLDAPAAPGQARFGIVQGGTDVALRRAHLDEIAALPVDGLALGGFSVGEPVERMVEVLAEVAPAMPADRPRYLMGVGTPFDLLAAIGAGVDLFDCVLPTRNARGGQALTWQGRVNLRQARHKHDESALDPRCECPTCRTFSRAYLHHLVRSKEMLGPRLLTHHNLWFYGALTRAARAAIEEGRYAAWAERTAARMRELDELGPPDADARPWTPPAE